jgi:hypothetical protein
MRVQRLRRDIAPTIGQADIYDPSHRLRGAVAAPLTMRGGYVGDPAVGQLKSDLVDSLKAKVAFLR